ncbi:hydroxyacid dehydrogenase [Candidatus Gracilibacteria bacterium]|nr:hydroxyacid dehydrogenase [Candidatus Gracilibacteria bacterium]
MQQIKILHIDLESEYKSLYLEALPEAKHIFCSKEEFEANLSLYKNVGILNLFIHNSISKEILKVFKNLKLINTRSTGYNHLDLDALKKSKTLVSNVPEYGSDTVAEHTFALIMGLYKNTSSLEEHSEKGNYEANKNFLGKDLNGKTIGVIGGGKIGKNVIQIAQGFDMKVLVYDIYQDGFLEQILNCKFVSLNYLLENSDIITLHTPLNSSTNQLIDEESLGRLHKGVTIINTARGELISNSILLKGLEQNIISGVGLDTIEGEVELIEGEKNPEQEKLLHHPKVIFTGHNAYHTKEAIDRIQQTSIRNIKSFINGNPINLV